MTPGRNPLTPQQLRVREEHLFLALTIVIGVLAGLSAVLFSLAINATNHALFGLTPSWARLLVVPAGVSLVTGFLLHWFFPGVRGSGVPQTKAAFHLHGGVIPPSVPIGKFLTGVLCIGSGHSMGREGPSVQIGAGLASAIGVWLRLSPERVKELVPVGAAGALAAAFNTPVSAVVFALEEIIGDMNATLLGSTVVASVASVVVERSLLGNEPLFHVPVYHLVHPAELVAYAVLGLVGGVVSLVFTQGLLRLRAVFRRLPMSSVPFQPALGGLMIGLLLIVVPEVMGVGYASVDAALNGGLLPMSMAILLGAKLLGTTVSYVSGNAGGIFAPSLFIGAMVGGLVGAAVHAVSPFPTGDTGAYALVGMGALFAGIIRAPMTSVFMIFEITQDYQIIVPLMVANLLAFSIARRYQPAPVYHALLEQDGVHLPAASPEDRPPLTAADLRDDGLPTVSCSATVNEALAALESAHAGAVLLADASGLRGVLSHARLDALRAAGLGERGLATVQLDGAVHVHADHPVQLVIDRLMAGGGVVPIVPRTNVHRVEGAVTADSLLRVVRRPARPTPPPPG